MNKLYPALLLCLLLTGSVAALEVREQTKRHFTTGEVGRLDLWIRPERNYSSQRVDLTITSDKTVLLNNCNGTYTETFSSNRKAWDKINPTLQFSNPGTYKITLLLSNIKYNQTENFEITVTGPARNLKGECAKQVGNRREKYGQGQPSPVKDRLKNTTRKYAVW